MRGRKLLAMTATLFAALAWLAACAQSTTSGQQAFTSLHVLRTSAVPQNHIPPFEATSNDAAKVRQFYQTQLALPTPPSGPIFCPDDFGAAYQLTFFSGTTVSTRATVAASGCRYVKIDGTTRGWVTSDTSGSSSPIRSACPSQPSTPSCRSPAGRARQRPRRSAAAGADFAMPVT
jgi:hypothetical protein